MTIFWLAIAGALGVLARYGITLGVQGWLGEHGRPNFMVLGLGSTFPLGTLVINVSGAFLLSFLTTLALAGTVRPNARLILGTGFCGGYTTFSTFELEAESLMSRGDWTAASAYVLGNLVLGFLAILAGRALALRLLSVLPSGTGI